MHRGDPLCTEIAPKRVIMAPQNDTPETRLAVCRERIDDIDRRLVTLLNERTNIVETIGQVKKEAQLPVYEPKREDAVYANVAAHNSGPMPNDAVMRIFERIMDEMRKIQRERMNPAGKSEDKVRGQPC
jgi:chorismate mutase-like protein